MKRIPIFYMVLFFTVVIVSQLTAQETFPILLQVNDATTGTVKGSVSNGYLMVDALEAMPLCGAEVHLCTEGFAIRSQYGRNFSALLVNREKAIVKCQPQTVARKAWRTPDSFMVPYDFLAMCLDGMASYNESENVLTVTCPPVQVIGSTIPLASEISTRLASKGCQVQQGAIYHSSAVKIFSAGYTPDCNGNNANFPYLIMTTPVYPGAGLNAYDFPWIYRIEPTEAIVMIGNTPPECIYFSYRSYLINRYYDDGETPERKKLFASLGNTINHTVLNGSPEPSMIFNHPIMVISTACQNTADLVKQAAMVAGFSENDIYLDVVPSCILNMGFNENADTLSILHRVSLIKDENEKETYLGSPPLEILRITPGPSSEFSPLPLVSLIERTTGVTEFELTHEMNELRTAIIDRYTSYGTPMVFPTHDWFPEGLSAIQSRLNVLGEVHDTLYLATDDFRFMKNDLVVVFGVNHTKTGKAVYANVSCYGAEYSNGIGGVTNEMYERTASDYIPGHENSDKFYVWKFARFQFDEQTFVVPPNTNMDFTGIDYGDKTFVAFRAYIDNATGVGPASWETIHDEVIVFRPRKTSEGNSWSTR